MSRTSRGCPAWRLPDDIDIAVRALAENAGRARVVQRDRPGRGGGQAIASIRAATRAFKEIQGAFRMIVLASHQNRLGFW